MRLAPFLVIVAACGRYGFNERIGNSDATGSDASPLGFTALVAYADQTCALFAGDAYCWGGNSFSQIGDGTTIDAPTPRRVMLPVGVEMITQGEEHGCAIVNGSAYCWGMSIGPTPTKIALPAAATSIAAGKSFTCVLADVVRCWGLNDVGQCGMGTTAPQTVPAAVLFQGGTYAATSIDAGDDHACADAPGVAPQCWGHNDFGSLGTGSLLPDQSLTAIAVTGGIAMTPMIAGWHACSLENGNVWCWGEGTMGELGDGLDMTSGAPVQVPSLANATAIATGGGLPDHDASCAIVDGNVSCWGRGGFGRLGQGSAVKSSVPVAVVGLPGPAVTLALGHNHSCALLGDGDIWCWGRGDRGQLGNGLKTSSLVPVPVVRP